jgi:hypothetical protein
MTIAPSAPYTVETITVERVAKTIDHSLLKPELTAADVLDGCAIAAAYDVASVCCRPLDALIECLNAGIDRCGATATAAIIDDLRTRQA